MIQWATVLFCFSVEEVLISSVFTSMGCKSPQYSVFFTYNAQMLSALPHHGGQIFSDNLSQKTIYYFGVQRVHLISSILVILQYILYCLWNDRLSSAFFLASFFLRISIITRNSSSESPANPSPTDNFAFLEAGLFLTSVLVFAIYSHGNLFLILKAEAALPREH